MVYHKEPFCWYFIYLKYRKPEKTGIYMKADFGIFGGDSRGNYLAADLRERGYRVITYGLPKNQGQNKIIQIPEPAEEAETLAELVQNSKILVGPVPFSKYVTSRNDAGGIKDAPCSHQYKNSNEKDQARKALLENMQKEQILYAGGIPDEFIKEAGRRGAACKDFLKDQSYVQANAWLTAEGCIAELLAAFPGSIKGMKIFVAGYGCCGSAIAELAKQMGAEVTVCVRNINSAWKAHEAGCHICYFEGMNEALPEQDAIVNTVPALVFDETSLQKAKPKSLLVEIASAPGGFSKEAAEKAGLFVLCCPGLPGKYSPAGAAKAIADCILI